MTGSLRVVLVRPEIAGNIGAVARVMKNFGWSDLTLVAPKGNPHSQEARQRAAHGETILESARLVGDLDAALYDCIAVAGTSARNQGIVRSAAADIPEHVLHRLHRLMAAGPVALMFGPEPSGLSNEEISRCDFVISIPAHPDYPVLNLSHAAAICLYELQRQSADPVESAPVSEPPATEGERELMFRHLRTALEDVHFLWDDKADLLFLGLRRLIMRARPTANDVRILHGIASQLEWVVRNDYKCGDSSAD